MTLTENKKSIVSRLITLDKAKADQSRRRTSCLLPPYFVYQATNDDMDATESRTMKARREGSFFPISMSRSIV
jgi:hypothetical protein